MDPIPFLTNNLPGIGGAIKTMPADFRVHEIPLYLPSGKGTHTYARIEKKGFSTPQAVRRISGALHINARDVGYAGLKDAHAVTVQTLSLGDISPKRVEALDLPGIRVLEVSRHTNKLKIGHLRGNRFVIRIRGVSSEALPRAKAVLDVLTERGVPNFFGVQRFGLRGDTHLLGRALVLGDAQLFIQRFLGMPHPAESEAVQKARSLFQSGDREAALRVWPSYLADERRTLQTLLKQPDAGERAVRSIPHRTRKFFSSAYQSHLFNQLLVRRLPAIDRLLVGDLTWIHGKGAVFVVESVEKEQPRADRLEISPSGPMLGFKVTLAQGEPGQMERQLLDQEGLELDAWRKLKSKGVRRPLRFPLRDLELRYDEGVVLSFTLPSGCYATVILNEVMK